MAVQGAMNDGVGTITLSDPPLNILSRLVLAEVRHLLQDLAAQPSARVLLLTAEGKHFSAGASVPEHLPPDFEVMIPEFMETIRALIHFPLPVVAAVQGRCLGGGFELAMAADIVVAAEGALLGVPEIQLGVIAPAACAQLPLLTSPGVAAELLFSGDPVDARTAAEAGLVRRVVPDDALQEEAVKLARRIARHSAAALRQAKRALRAGTPHLDAALERAGEIYLNDLMTTADAVEGLQAFVDKRPPKWSHT